MSTQRWILAAAGCVLGIAGAPGRAAAQELIDLSLELAPDLPCVWPGGLPHFTLTPYHPAVVEGPASEILFIDEHTGTQWDAPAHFVPPPRSGLPNATEYGNVTGDLVPAWQFCGEACVIDVGALRDQAEPGKSALIQESHVIAWEKQHRQLGPGDVVLFRSGYSDAYYKPFPDGSRFVADPLALKAPAWPAPDPQCMRLVASRGVTGLGLDSPSMGPLPDLAADTHIAGGARGLIWAECLTNLTGLPPTGAFYALLGAKHARSSGGEARAVAVPPGDLANRLIAAARVRRTVDLTLLLDESLPSTWPGRGTGKYRSPYLGLDIHRWDDFGGPYFARAHRMDSGAGTHLVAPGALKEGAATAAQVPLNQTCGPLRVVDLTRLVGTADPRGLPASPAITAQAIAEHEGKHGPIAKGEIVVFRTGHADRTYRPKPEDVRYAADPLAGKAEGWPALDAAALAYLAERGITCLGIDAPSIGSVRFEEAMSVYNAGAERGVVFLEGLTGLGQLPEKGAYLLFAPIKIRGSRTTYGRALALLTR